MTSPTPHSRAATTKTTVPAVTPQLPFQVYSSAGAAMRAVQRRLAGATPAGLNWDPQRHVCGRLGFGLRIGEQVGTFDPDDWWRQQTDPAVPAAPYRGVDGLVDAMPTLLLDGPQTRDWLTANTSGPKSGGAMVQLNRATAILQAFSPCQLFEVLTDVFANHLNVVNLTEGNDWTRTSFDRDVIRAHAFGRFADMLHASARDPAMMFFLNNDVSTGTKMNENYGREILELHTVGVGAGYTQDEVISSARILTGRGRQGPTYLYTPGNHWTGPVSVLGFSDPNPNGAGGEAVGDRYVDYLAHHPLTAANLATKLCLRLVSDFPSPALVSAVAQAYLSHDTSILPMVYTILCSSEFWASRGAKPRRPLEHLMAAVRALGVTPASDLSKAGAALASLLTQMGQTTFGCKTPNGYSLRGTDWLCAGGWVDMWDVQQALATDEHSEGLSFDGRSVVAAAAQSTVGQTWNCLAQRIVGCDLQPGQLDALAAHFGDSPSSRYDTSGMQGRPVESLFLLIRVLQFSVS